MARREIFEILAADLLSERRQARRGAADLRLLSVGAGDGIDAYAAAMTVLSVFGGWVEPHVPVVATTLEPVALDWCPGTIFPATAIKSLAGPLRRRFFLCGFGGFRGLVRVREEVRSLVTFRSWERLRVEGSGGGSFDAILWFGKPEVQHVPFAHRLLKRDGVLVTEEEWAPPEDSGFVLAARHVARCHHSVLPPGKPLDEASLRLVHKCSP